MASDLQTSAPERIHFPRTTFSQRQLLFRTWESGGDIEIGILKIVVSIINLKFIKES